MLQLNIYLYEYVYVCAFTYWKAHYVNNGEVHLTYLGAIYDLHKTGADMMHKIVSCYCW
jgi:hypothetical protein